MGTCGRTGDLEPLDGMVKRHNHLKIGWYHQHLADLLDLALTPLEYMFREFPEARSQTRQRCRVWGRGFPSSAGTTST